MYVYMYICITDHGCVCVSTFVISVYVCSVGWYTNRENSRQKQIMLNRGKHTDIKCSTGFKHLFHPFPVT